MSDYDILAAKMLPDTNVIDADEDLQEAAEGVVDYWEQAEPDAFEVPERNRDVYGDIYCRERVIDAVRARIEQRRGVAVR